MNLFYFYPQRFAFRACCHYFLLFSRKFSCVPTGTEKHFGKVMSDRTGGRRGSNAYYKQVAKKLHLMFRIVPIFFVFWGKGEKREETDGYGYLLLESPRGFAHGKSCCRRGFKAKPLRQSMDRRIGSGASSKPRAGSKIAPLPLTRHQKMRTGAIASCPVMHCPARRVVRGS